MINEIYKDGVLLERVIDNEDGTGTHYIFDLNGEVIEMLELIDLPVMEGLENLNNDPSSRAVKLANELLEDPILLSNLVEAISVGNSAKGSLEYINNAVQNSVALTENEIPGGEDV